MNKGSNGLSQQVAARFSAAADNYHSYDVLQQQTAQRLLKQTEVSGRLLDIGAGPGTCFAHLPSVKQVICLDIAEGMLSTLTANYPHYQAICADAQNLPLLDNSVDGIYSNVALQWCQQLPQAITEANRVLTAGAEFNMSIVAKDSLQQLAALGFKINQFIEQSTLLAGFDKSQWDIELCETQAISLHFDTLKSMLQSIKGVGASIVKQQQDVNLPQVTLRGRKDWQALQAKAELSRAPEGLPLTYNICFIKARKKR
ncbi:methyltransferase domain-containing protein [Shewanella marinintestina]|uniref:methyltransferase domain-containing protein n=1 Tax=Shewanella marinintestina TaxID=190305 RepID=UPI00200CEC09|nr:methyltransferase domain-containing protein [Shewanella marinintestina]